MNSYEKFTNNYPFPYEYPNISGQTRAMSDIHLKIFGEKPLFQEL